LPPSFTKIKIVARDKTTKRNDARDTAAEASVTAAARDRGERLAAVGLSLLSAALSPGNRHGGAWNKTLLITHTRVRIE
jgi:hypothetical protein